MGLSKLRTSLVFSIVFAGVISFCSATTTFGQQGNTVTGQVTGSGNKPLYDATVELLNDYGSSVAYTKTDGSGRYFFSNVRAGRFSVRVRPLDPEYEEQSQSEEIVNFTRQAQDGSVRQSGMELKQLDFRMRVRKDFIGITAAVFAQDVPANAKTLYEKAVSDLSEKNEKEGLAGLKAAIEAFPRYFAALERFGMECIRIKQYLVSVTLLQIAVDVNPRSYRSWYGLAYSLNALDYHDEALTAVKKSLELYGGSAEALLLAGVIQKSKRQFSDAEKSLIKAKELSKDAMPMINWHLALLYGKEMKRYSEAARELKAFLKKQPESKDSETIKKLIADYESKARSS